jgi:hypothetical protein
MTETSEFPDMMARMLRAWTRRVAAADTYDLREMADVLGRNADPVWEAVRINRETQDPPWSWSDIGAALGIKRQAAQQNAQRHAKATAVGTSAS